MLAWLVIWASIHPMLARRSGEASNPETVMAVAIGLAGAILGGFTAVFVVEGQRDLEWQPSGAVGVALGALLILLWLHRSSD